MVESQPLFRSALEYAGYALHFTRNPELQEIWIRRHDDLSASRAVRRRFSMSEVNSTLEGESGAIARSFTQVYELTIDFGGHPNERALTTRLNLRRESGQAISSVTQLSDQPRDYLFTVRTALRVGAICLAIFDRIFQTKFRLAGIDREIDALRQAAGAD
jgi:hypothetical protein